MEISAIGLMSLHQHSEVNLAINFPNSPNNGDTYTEGTVQWQYSSSNNAWTMITTGVVGVDNGTNHDQEVLFLDRNVSNQNIPTAGVGFTYNPSTRTVVIKGATSQSNNLIELTDNANVVLNSFNQRGILSKAGRVYYQSTTPAVNAADIGQLWYNTSNNTLLIWSGTAWNSVGSGVDITTSQIITGAKTFSSSSGLTLDTSCSLVGASSLLFKPFNTLSLTLSNTAANFAVPINFSAVGADVKNAVVTKADTMIVDGVKTFSGTINASSGILLNSSSGLSRVFSSATTSPGANTDSIILQPTQSSSGRYIRLYSNHETLETTGITIRPKNENNQGTLNVIGNTKITGDLVITGNLSSGATTATIGATSIGSFKSQNGTGVGNINVVPKAIGPLTFAHTLDIVNWLPTVNVTNSSPVAVSFYYKRDQVQIISGVSTYTYGITLFVLNGNSTISIPITNIAGMSAGPYTKTSLTSSPTVISLANLENSPVVTSFIIC